MTKRGRRNGIGRGSGCIDVAAAATVVAVATAAAAVAVAIAMDAAFEQFDFIAWQNSMKRAKRQSDKRTN